MLNGVLLCCAGIGSGGQFAVAAARALIDIPELSALDIAKKVDDTQSADADCSLSHSR